MKRFSMFGDFGDIEKKRAKYTNGISPIIDELGQQCNEEKYNYFSTLDEGFSIISSGKMSEDNHITNEQRYEALKFLWENKDFLEATVDIAAFFLINYTCDYLLAENGEAYISLSETEWRTDFIEKNFNCGVDLRGDAIEYFSNNRKKLKLNIDAPFEVVKSGKSTYIIKIPRLCKNFYLFILNNLRESPLYGGGDTRKDYQKYLYKMVFNRFIDDKYNFDYSDYFIFEALTGFNFATTLSVLLDEKISDGMVKKFGNTKRDYNKIKMAIYKALTPHAMPMLYKIIPTKGTDVQTYMDVLTTYSIFPASMIYVNSIIIQYLYSKMPDDVKGPSSRKMDENDWLTMLGYLLMQIYRVKDLHYRKYEVSIYQKFYELFDEYNDGKDGLEVIRKVKEKNIAEFENGIISNIYGKQDASSRFRGKSLIQDKKIQEEAEKIFLNDRTINMHDKLNAYIQKSVIMGINDILKIKPQKEA